MPGMPTSFASRLTEPPATDGVPIDVARTRARNLRLEGRKLDTPEEVVAWLGAVQAQDYVPAQWSVAQRARGVTSADVDEAIGKGAVVRTHVLRPTWHFLARGDARTVLGLTGPRVQRANASRYRELDLDTRTLARSERVILRALGDGSHLTRAELGEQLTRSGIDVSGQRLPHVLMHCELALAICSGARRGKEHTYAAFDDRVPASKRLDDADATRWLVQRYLRSHGPASIPDIQWWASLRASDVRTALDELGSNVRSSITDGIELWWYEPHDASRSRSSVTLLETYDEFIVGYTRTRFLGDARAPAAGAGWRGGPVRNVVIRGGTVVGLWKRAKTNAKVSIGIRTFGELSPGDLSSLRREVDRFGAFYGLDPHLDVDVVDVG